MPWGRRRALRSTILVDVHDNLLGETVRVTRRAEEFEGYHSFGRVSYRGESLKLVMGFGGIDYTPAYTAEEYPPPLHRCKTERARDWWRRDAPPAG